MLIKSLTVGMLSLNFCSCLPIGMLVVLMIIEIKLVARMLYLNMRDRNVVDFLIRHIHLTINNLGVV